MSAYCRPRRGATREDDFAKILISPQPEPHLAQKWVAGKLDAVAHLVIYVNDGLSEPAWHRHERRVTVDRTYALNSAYEEIKAGLWWIPRGADMLDSGDFYAQMKAPTRVRDMSDGTLRYRWVETGPVEYYRHAQAYDHVAAEIARKNPPAAMAARRRAFGWRAIGIEISRWPDPDAGPWGSRPRAVVAVIAAGQRGQATVDPT